MANSELAAQILARVEADPDAFAPGLGGFATVCSHAVWPEDHIDGHDTEMGIAGWACHLSGWKLSTDDIGVTWAFVEDWEQRRNPVEVAAELLGLETTSLLVDPDRDAAIAGLRAIAEMQSVQPTIVCICGSMRFQEQMVEAAAAESLAGRIVVMPHVNTKLWGQVANPDETKRDLDLLHRAKIRMAQEVLVVNVRLSS